MFFRSRKPCTYFALSTLRELVRSTPHSKNEPALCPLHPFSSSKDIRLHSRRSDCFKDFKLLWEFVQVQTSNIKPHTIIYLTEIRRALKPFHILDKIGKVSLAPLVEFSPCGQRRSPVYMSILYGLSAAEAVVGFKYVASVQVLILFDRLVHKKNDNCRGHLLYREKLLLCKDDPYTLLTSASRSSWRHPLCRTRLFRP